MRQPDITLQNELRAHYFRSLDKSEITTPPNVPNRLAIGECVCVCVCVCVCDKILNAFRTDGEKTTISLPADNVDVSEVFALGTETEVTIKEGASRFLNYINQFEVVNTNRLHVAISATLLGKSVNFYPNNYFKCQAVYDYSLSNYRNLTWHTNKSSASQELQSVDTTTCK